MSTVSIRLPDSLHETVSKLSKKGHVSINQFVTTALAEKISALITEDFLAERAKRGKKSKFQKAMAKVADVEAADIDRL